MPVSASDIKFYLSGGAANSNVNAALGGAKSSTEYVSNTDANIFDDVSASEASAGDTEYRGFYVENTNGSSTLTDARIFISAGDSLSDIDLAIADEAVNTTIETIANESTAPVGPTFTHPTTYAGGLQLNGSGGLAPADDRGVWIRRTIAASTSAQTAYSFTLRTEGTTI